MFNQRQLEILLELCENPDNYLTASYFAKKQQVSLRTVQNDIKQIKMEVAEKTCVEFQSVAPKGCRIHVLDLTEFAAWKETLYQQFSNSSMGYRNERIDQILLLLLNQHRAISMYDLENKIYVSRSTLLNDLKQVDTVLSRFNLELLRSANKVMIDGSEVNKRMCLLEQNLLIANAATVFSGNSDNDTMRKIKDILVETFVSFKHSVTEVGLNNAIIQLYVALNRMQNWFFISPADLDLEGESLSPEREIAAAVFQRIGQDFLVRVPEEEVDYFALYMKGQGNYTSTTIISQEMDDFVLAALTDIRDTHGIDLTNDLNLRIALALHCTPLIVRIKYDMQLKNHLVNYIRQTFPQGFDLGTYFAAYMQKVFHKKVSDEEIAFIAIHLYNSLTQQQQNQGTKRLLVISSLRRSENILLRQTLLNWFSDQLTELAFLMPQEVDDDCLDRYDIFVTTEKGTFYDMGLAFYINQFPNQQDYLNLKLAMDGFRNIDDIFAIFHQELFFQLPNRGREAVLRHMCQKSSEFFHIEGLHSAVLQREELGSTFFGNGIAAPHPIAAVSSDSFVCTAVLPQAIEWDSDHNMVNLVILICIGKNNTKAFQLWNYLSKLFADKHFVERLLPSPSYDNFIKLLKDTISDNFNN
ncbi:MAG: BglG family transcription antiterminator [Clostridiales bacterium]|nr:BglG family transcription antiterminator [Clostridiales bacterium]